MRLYIGGTFDLIHPGHIDLLRRCEQLGEVHVALNRDDFVLRYKGRLPVQTLADRKEVMQAIRYVKQVWVNTGDEDSRPAIRMVRPNYIVHGSDWVGADLYRQMGFDAAWLADNNISMLYLDTIPGYSTSELRRRILEGGTNGDSPRDPRPDSGEAAPR